MSFLNIRLNTPASAEQRPGFSPSLTEPASVFPHAAGGGTAVRVAALREAILAGSRGRITMGVVHKAWKPPSGFQKEFRLPSGRRADAVNPTTREVIELKPNNLRAIREGQRQIERYVQEFEQITKQKWTGRVETY